MSNKREAALPKDTSEFAAVVLQINVFKFQIILY